MINQFSNFFLVFVLIQVSGVIFRSHLFQSLWSSIKIPFFIDAPQSSQRLIYALVPEAFEQSTMKKCTATNMEQKKLIYLEEKKENIENPERNFV